MSEMTIRHVEAQDAAALQQIHAQESTFSSTLSCRGLLCKRGRSILPTRILVSISW